MRIHRREGIDALRHERATALQWMGCRSAPDNDGTPSFSEALGLRHRRDQQR
jgi:hypothetical protein